MGLPDGLQGIILRESEKLSIEGAQRELKFGGKFDKFTYWNYDKNPSENDAYKQALHWLKVSEAVSRVKDLSSESENIKFPFLQMHSEIESFDDDEPSDEK